MYPLINPIISYHIVSPFINGVVTELSLNQPSKIANTECLIYSLVNYQMSPKTTQ